MTVDLDAARRALATDQTIDIVTIGARTGQRRTTEIWFTRVDDEIFITGTPAGDGTPGARRRRDCLANLTANPTFDFVLKETADVVLPAIAEVVTDRDERVRVLSAPETAWNREAIDSVERMVDDAPLVRVTFVGEAATLNAR